MSEYKCPEPDCAFTLGSDYPMLIELHGRWHRATFEEIKEHQRMPGKGKARRNLRQEMNSGRVEIEEVQTAEVTVSFILQGCAPVNFRFQVIDDVQQFSLSVGGATHGAGVGTSESTERGVTPGEPETKTSPAALPAGDKVRLEIGDKVFNAVQLGTSRVRSAQTVVLEGDSRHRRDPESHVIAGIGKASEDFAFTAFENLNDSDLKLSEISVGHSKLEGSISDSVDEESHNSSLSVGGVPYGAGVGTSESTEGDSTGGAAPANRGNEKTPGSCNCRES